MSMALMVAALLAAQGVDSNNRPQQCIFDLRRGSIVLAYGLGERSVAPGETVRIAPQWTPFPQSYYAVPDRCLQGWRVSDRRLAILSRDGRALIIATNAPEGSVVTLSARYRSEALQQRFRVIAPMASPLLGTWVQRAGCDEANRVFSIAFNRDGGFSVSFVPHYHGGVDYRGRWRVEGNRLILSNLERARADALPADGALEAGFTIAGDRLTFTRNWYGTSGQRGACEPVFTREM